MPSPKWLKETKRQKAHALGKAGEKRTLKSLPGSRPTRRSGAGAQKGDGRWLTSDHTGRLHEFHIESKSTFAQQYRLTTRTLKKLALEAGYSRIPLLVVEFTNVPPRGHRERYFILPQAAFHALTGIAFTAAKK